MGFFKKLINKAGDKIRETADDLGDWYRETTPWDTPAEKDDRAEKLEQDAKDKAKAQGQSTDAARKIKEQQLKDMVAQRQAVINPNDQMTNQFAGMTNQMANLGVATQAAEFQAEEADKALASTLDTMRASGAGAGGATALAQAALQSKRGISADLQKQEAANQKAAAQGAQQIQTQIAQGATNIQTQQARGAAELQAQKAQGANDLQMNIARGAADVDRLSRQGATDVQNQFAAGRQFAFSVGEQRQNQDIDRSAQQLDNYNKRVADAAAQLLAAQTS